MTPNYPLGFRKSLLNQLCLNIIKGESSALIGVYGVGKSHLLQHLLRHDVQAQHFADIQDFSIGEVFQENVVNPNTCFFIRLDANAMSDDSSAALLQLLYSELHSNIAQDERFAKLASELEPETHKRSEKELFAHLIELIKKIFACLAQNVARFVIIIDSSERLYELNDPTIARNLRAIRDNFRYHLVYIISSRYNPLQFIEENKAAKLEAIIDLLHRSLVFVIPYQDDDYQLAFNTLCERLQIDKTLHSSKINEWIRLYSGGHGRLMRTLLDKKFLDMIEASTEETELIVSLLKEQSLIYECQNLLASMSKAEINLLRKICMAENLDLSAKNLSYLMNKGMIKRESGYNDYSLSIPLLIPLLRLQLDEGDLGDVKS